MLTMVLLQEEAADPLERPALNLNGW